MMVKMQMEHLLHVCRALEPASRAEVVALGWAEAFDPQAAALAIWHSAAFGHALIDGDSRPHTVCGYSFTRPGVARSFLVSKPGFKSHVKELTRHCRRVMAALLGNGGAHRLETLSAATHTGAHRWFGLLGLEREALLRGYGRGGEDFYLFVRRA